MSVCFIKLVDHPLAPFVLCENRNVFFIGVTANGTGKELCSGFNVGRFFCYNTVIKLMICGFGLVTATEMAVSLSIIIGSPIAELMVCGRNVLCSRMHASLTGVGLNSGFLASRFFGDLAVIPLMRKGFELIAVVVHAVTLVIFVTVGIPIRPSTFVHQLVNRLGLGVRADTAGVGSDAFFPFGRLFGYNTVIKVMLVCLITVTNSTGHLVSVFVHT
jgi:hypothetical protein